ncbi:hypothetical protein [Roseibium alexandrii]|uniref:hypothetical protein n=1 Tax=Roseibium alexandrii TaxID=388408 RepID=UPI003752FA02
MNYSTAIFLINDNARAVMAVYESHESAPKTMFKTLDPNIEEGDFVLVQSGTRHGMTVVKVVDTDPEIEPDFDSHDELKWIVGTIDLEDFEVLKKQEDEAILAIKKAEKRKKRSDLRKTLMADYEETIKELPIAGAGDQTASLSAPSDVPEERSV